MTPQETIADFLATIGAWAALFGIALAYTNGSLAKGSIERWLAVTMAVFGILAGAFTIWGWLS